MSVGFILLFPFSSCLSHLLLVAWLSRHIASIGMTPPDDKGCQRYLDIIVTRITGPLVRCRKRCDASPAVK
jgi:hypothetical protein